MSNEQQPYGEGGDCRCIHCGIPDSRTWVCERCQKEQDVRARKSLRKDTMPTQQRMTPEQMAEIVQRVELLDEAYRDYDEDADIADMQESLKHNRSLLAEVQRQQDEKQRLCDWLTHFAVGAQREAETQSDRDRAMYAEGGAHVARELVRMIQSGRFTKAGVS
ncbi:hypothetical protein [Paenibacillus sp. P22]|uniref:hypothetical protein n=1 Tax=Paenibacillus sp. P22 TaxID=483908 RepID=UPI00038F3D26|nr:hypothetical protein [Paenibacillus sp. P22]CDN42064.1 hypothetical protein BN871_AT_00660 [Paenibacillus sp. P22]